MACYCLTTFKFTMPFEISEEALGWLSEQTASLLGLVETVCSEHLAMLERNSAWQRFGALTAEVASRKIYGPLSAATRRLLQIGSDM